MGGLLCPLKLVINPNIFMEFITYIIISSFISVVAGYIYDTFLSYRGKIKKLWKRIKVRNIELAELKKKYNDQYVIGILEYKYKEADDKDGRFINVLLENYFDEEADSDFIKQNKYH